MKDIAHFFSSVVVRFYEVLKMDIKKLMRKNLTAVFGNGMILKYRYVIAIC
jgi:hypothetical protein